MTIQHQFNDPKADGADATIARPSDWNADHVVTDIVIQGLARKISGDLSNATVSNRVLWQSSTVNGGTSIAAIPNGIASFSQWQAYDASDTLNAGRASLAAITGEARISQDKFGTASYGPITFYTSGAERMRVDASGRLSIGASVALWDGTTAVDPGLSANAGTLTAKLVLESTNASAAQLFWNRRSAGANGFWWSATLDASNNLTFTRAQQSSGDYLVNALVLTPTGNVGAGTATPNYGGLTKAVTVEGAFHSGFEVSSTRADATGALIGAFVGQYRTNSAGHTAIAEISVETNGATANQRGGDLAFYTKPNASTTLTERMRIYEGGAIGVSGTVKPVTDNAYSLGVVTTNRYANIYTVNAVTVGSDARDKTNIKSTPLGLDFINALNPVSYTLIVGGNDVVTVDLTDDEVAKLPPEKQNELIGRYKSVVTPRPGKRVHYGLLAQEVKLAADKAGVDFGGWVKADVNDPLSGEALRYDEFVAPLIKAVQELSAQVEALKLKVK